MQMNKHTPAKWQVGGAGEGEGGGKHVQESGNTSDADEMEVTASVDCDGEDGYIGSSSGRQKGARTTCRAVRCRGSRVLYSVQCMFHEWSGRS